MPEHDAVSPLDAQRDHWDRTFSGRSHMFGRTPSEPARFAATTFERTGVRKVMELGGGQGRDTVYFASRGFDVQVLDYARAGLLAIRAAAEQAGVSASVEVTQHDLRLPLPAGDGSFDACYSHMLFCMAFTTAELAALSREILRVLRPGGVCVYTVRNTTDADFGRGVRRGDALYENNGFIVHFFDRAKIEQLAVGFELEAVDAFEEGALPRRLFRVVLRKPRA